MIYAAYDTVKQKICRKPKGLCVWASKAYAISYMERNTSRPIVVIELDAEKSTVICRLNDSTHLAIKKKKQRRAILKRINRTKKMILRCFPNQLIDLQNKLISQYAELKAL